MTIQPLPINNKHMQLLLSMCWDLTEGHYEEIDVDPDFKECVLFVWRVKDKTHSESIHWWELCTHHLPPLIAARQHYIDRAANRCSAHKVLHHADYTPEELSAWHAVDHLWTELYDRKRTVEGKEKGYGRTDLGEPSSRPETLEEARLRKAAK